VTVADDSNVKVAAADCPAPAATADGRLPFVTVAMPVLNEARFIADTLDMILAQDYPADRIEVIVADAMSSDGTREIVGRYMQDHPRIRLIDNPGRFRAAGLNLAIVNGHGDILICIDGHCHVAPDFIRQEVQLLEEHPDAWSVGGPTVNIGRNTFAKAAAVAMSHPCGVGMATHRFPNYEGYAEGACFPAFHRWVFDRVGLFDEAMVRTEDDELNYRITQAGGRAYVSPRVRYRYYVRDTPRKLFQQYVQYGFWRIPVMRKHKRPTTPRQVVPPLFFLTMLALAVVGMVLGQPIVSAALPVIYLGALTVIGIASIRRVGLKVACLVPLAMATIHFAYAAGILYGLFAAAFLPSAFEPTGIMSQQKR
jgi:glycosyltransferase involved in cell wall biosynthesis